MGLVAAKICVEKEKAILAWVVWGMDPACGHGEDEEFVRGQKIRIVGLCGFGNNPRTRNNAMASKVSRIVHGNVSYSEKSIVVGGRNEAVEVDHRLF